MASNQRAIDKYVQKFIEQVDFVDPKYAYIGRIHSDIADEISVFVRKFRTKKYGRDDLDILVNKIYRIASGLNQKTFDDFIANNIYDEQIDSMMQLYNFLKSLDVLADPRDIEDYFDGKRDE